MESVLPLPRHVTLGAKDFEVIKETRLTPGCVLRSTDGTSFARIGPKESALEEQIHTVSLFERGFPVPVIETSGPINDSEWFFVEKSLGPSTFHEQFAAEYANDMRVSDATFSRYLSIVERYLAAQFSSSNYTTVRAADFIDAVIPRHEIDANYLTLGRDVNKYATAITRATKRLETAQTGILQFDLNPCNMLDGGIIDFELVGYGALGYDTLMAARWHRYFTHYSSRFHIAYELSEQQIEANDQLVDAYAKAAGLAPPTDFLREFTLIKTAWGFSSNKSIADEPDSKRWFYDYRAELLAQTVDAYLADELISCMGFPDITPPSLQRN